MTQHDYHIEANLSGLRFREDVNAALLAIATNNSGSSNDGDFSENNFKEYQFFADEHTNKMRFFGKSESGDTNEFYDLWNLNSGLHNIAITGNYNDLENKPTNLNSSITLQDEGTLVSSNIRTLNFIGSNVSTTSNNEIANIDISDFGIIIQNNGSSLSNAATTLNFEGSNITVSGNTEIKTITIQEFSGNYEDLTNIPTLTTEFPITGSGTNDDPITLISYRFDENSNIEYAIDGSFIPPFSIISSHIANNAIIESTITDGAVSEAKIADSAVSEAKIADSAVSEAKIADSAVSEAKIADSAVSEAKIADSAVSEAKIADEAVGLKHLNSQLKDTTLVEMLVICNNSNNRFNIVQPHNQYGSINLYDGSASGQNLTGDIRGATRDENYNIYFTLNNDIYKLNLFDTEASLYFSDTISISNEYIIQALAYKYDIIALLNHTTNNTSQLFYKRKYDNVDEYTNFNINSTEKFCSILHYENKLYLFSQETVDTHTSKIYEVTITNDNDIATITHRATVSLEDSTRILTVTGSTIVNDYIYLISDDGDPNVATISLGYFKFEPSNTIQEITLNLNFYGIDSNTNSLISLTTTLYPLNINEYIKAVRKGQTNIIDIASVAISGSYNDLKDKPDGITIQEEGVDLNTEAKTLNFEGNGVTVTGNTAIKTITIEQFSGNYDDLTNAPTFLNSVNVESPLSGTGNSDSPITINNNGIDTIHLASSSVTGPIIGAGAVGISKLNATTQARLLPTGGESGQRLVLNDSLSAVWEDTPIQSTTATASPFSIKVLASPGNLVVNPNIENIFDGNAGNWLSNFYVFNDILIGNIHEISLGFRYGTDRRSQWNVRIDQQDLNDIGVNAEINWPGDGQNTTSNRRGFVNCLALMGKHSSGQAKTEALKPTRQQIHWTYTGNDGFAVLTFFRGNNTHLTGMQIYAIASNDIVMHKAIATTYGE